MSGILIAGGLLRGDAATTTVVPPAQIKAWMLPQGTPTPSLLLTRISRTKQQFLAAEHVWLMIERIQVTIRSANGEQRDEIRGLAERACTDKTGTIAGFSNVAVLHAGVGPDFMDEAATIFMGSFDLRVSFNEPA